jgi:hypothetical protein
MLLCLPGAALPSKCGMWRCVYQGEQQVVPVFSRMQWIRVLVSRSAGANIWVHSVNDRHQSLFFLVRKFIRV